MAQHSPGESDKEPKPDEVLNVSGFNLPDSELIAEIELPDLPGPRADVRIEHFTLGIRLPGFQLTTRFARQWRGQLSGRWSDRVVELLLSSVYLTVVTSAATASAVAVMVALPEAMSPAVRGGLGGCVFLVVLVLALVIPRFLATQSNDHEG